MKTVLTVTLFLVLAAPAAAATPDQIMRNLAANQTHSWADDDIGIAGMAARYHNGERLYVTCGNVAEFARQLLSGAGYPARVVQTITHDEFDYGNDGHLMTEVFSAGHWQLYDVDANRRAVDASGHGVSLVDQVAAVREDRAVWETIATDPLLNDNEPDQELLAAARMLFADMPAFYRRVMGTVLLPRDPAGTVTEGMWFVDADQEERLHEYDGGANRFLASSQTWDTLTAPAVTVAPVAPVTSPAAPIAVQPAAVISRATAKPRSCSALKRHYQRTRTYRAHRRYMRCRHLRRPVA